MWTQPFFAREACAVANAHARRQAERALAEFLHSLEVLEVALREATG